MKSVFKSWMKFISHSFTTDAKKASKELDKKGKEEEKKKIWSEICIKLKLTKDDEKSQNPKFKKALEEFNNKVKYLINDVTNKNTDKINRKFKKITNDQIRNLKKILKKNYFINENEIKKINKYKGPKQDIKPKKAKVITEELSKLKLVQKFSKDLYNQFNELYKKGDENQTIDKFRIYIYSEKEKKYYFNSHLFNLIINGRLHRKINLNSIKEEFTLYKNNYIERKGFDEYKITNKNLDSFKEMINDFCTGNNSGENETVKSCKNFDVTIDKGSRIIILFLFQDMITIKNIFDKFNNTDKLDDKNKQSIIEYIQNIINKSNNNYKLLFMDDNKGVEETIIQYKYLKNMIQTFDKLSDNEKNGFEKDSLGSYLNEHLNDVHLSTKISVLYERTFDFYDFLMTT